MNKVLLVGRLTKDPLIQTTAQGLKIARLTVAISRPFGENQTDFVPVTAWRQSAEFIERYAKKGNRVSVEGRYTTGSYEKDGQRHYTNEVTADRVDLLESRNDGASVSNTQSLNLNKPVTPVQESSNNSSDDVEPEWDIEI